MRVRGTGHKGSGSATAAARFPLRVASGERHLIDANDQPFLLQGDAAWSLIAQLDRNDVDRYLADRQSRGFNTLLVNLLEHRFATNAPANIHGDQPFTTRGDFSTPNDAYFAYAQWVLLRAAEKGFLVLLAPSYTGYRGGPQGWYEEMESNGTDRLRDFGRYLGRRYRSFSNVVWVQAGDFDPPRKELVDAIAEGIAEAMPTALQTAHGAPDTATADYWGDRPWLALNSIYPSGAAAAPSADQYARSVLPFFLIETAYENEHGTTTRRIRTQAYHALLNGAAGQVFGNNPMWHFDGPGLYEVNATWTEELASPGAQSMECLHRFLTRLAWWNLRPDVDRAFLTQGVESGDVQAVAAIACDRTFAVVYLPTDREITLDLSRLGGTSASLTWCDPFSGMEPPSPSPRVPTSGPVNVLPREDANADGEHDWVLLVATSG